MNRVKILYVEDNATQRELIQRLLELELRDYEIQFAGNGIEGFEKALQWLPDVILMDLRMPQMDGFEAIHRIRTLPTTANIPIITISAWINARNEDRAMKLGANACLVKPYDMDELIAAIKKCLQQEGKANKGTH